MPSQEVQKSIENWVSRVRGKCIDQKRRVVYSSIPIDYSIEKGLTAMESTATVDTETVIVLEIPVRELESIARTEEWYKRNIGGFPMDRFDKIIRQEHIEASLREKHPGLQELWEKYQIMLALCDDQSFN
jgi:hypothetical protein